MKYDQHTILKRLDAPIRILSFSIGDVAAYALPFFVGALLDNMFVLPIAGLLGIYLVKKALRKLPRFYLLRLLYWNLPTKHYNRLFKTQLPPSHKRLWIR